MHDPAWVVGSTHPFITHEAEPLYLANGVFGGLLDGSGTNMDCWSASVGGHNVADPSDALLYPVTLFRPRVFYRNAYFRAKACWMGRDGLQTNDARYTADPAMPHVPQVYQIRQRLHVRSGIAETSATLFPGSEAALEAGYTPERKIAFHARVAFLKNSSWMAMEIVSDPDTDILFAPAWLLEEHARLDVSAQGIYKIGSGIHSAIQLRQAVLEERVEGDTLIRRMQAEGYVPHEVVIAAPGAKQTTFDGNTAFMAHGSLSVFVRVCPPGHEPEDRPVDIFAEQARRWENFWSRSSVSLPAAEALWQQRYHASLFYVAQSIGQGPTHPTGLSKPNYPHWYGCFHDTDTYFCRPLLETGRADDARPHLLYRHRGLATARQLAASNGYPGALYPWQADINGDGEGIRCLVNSAIIACEAFNHYRHARRSDDQALAVDILHATFEYFLACVSLEASPVRLRPGHWPTFSETMQAGEPTEAVLAIRAVAQALLECGTASDTLVESAQRVLADLPLPRKETGGYAFDPGLEPEYQRCPSITLGAFPLHHLRPDADLQHSFEDELARTVFLFAWIPHQLSVVASQLQRRTGPTSAVELLRQADRFYKGNHAYDEWENRRTGRAETFVTAAGGFCTALHHMLLAETGEGEWSLFPGIPPAWRDVSFERLITRAGWVVSATLKDGELAGYEAKPVNERSADSFVLRYRGKVLLGR